MLYALAATVVVFGSSAAAFAAVNGDFGLGSSDFRVKQAYSAAQSGIQRYLFELDQDPNFWTHCKANTNWIENPGDPPDYQPVPGSTTESYEVTLLPANGKSQCEPSDPQGSMIVASPLDPQAGTIRISATGVAGAGPQQVKRTIVADLKQQSFLNYAYFTNYENPYPTAQIAADFSESVAEGSPDYTIEPPDQCLVVHHLNCGVNYDAAVNGGPGFLGSGPGAMSQCSKYRFDPKDPRYSKPFFTDAFHTYYCDYRTFPANDAIGGSFHTNDQATACGNPTFTRPNTNDTVSFGQLPGILTTPNLPPNALPNLGQCDSTNPNYSGHTPTQEHIDLPTQDDSLETIAQPPYIFSGTTCLTLTSSYIGYQQPTGSQGCFSSTLPQPKHIPYPSNGVLYVANSPTVPCDPYYNVDAPDYAGNNGCGTVYVQGTDEEPLTIASDDDVVIDGNISYSSDGQYNPVLGLIANDFVRLYHPIGGQPGDNTAQTCDNHTPNAADALPNPVIHAVIMSLTKSFMVDQYNCGSSGLGRVTVVGGVIQDYRGAIGTKVYGTGYGTLEYDYDNRLSYLEPPHFLPPVNARWDIHSQTECDTPTGCTAANP